MISRNFSFVYKGQSVNLREIAQKLGAQYLVEGSVRKSGGQLRVTAQLIDTASDTHIWLSDTTASWTTCSPSRMS